MLQQGIHSQTRRVLRRITQTLVVSVDGKTRTIHTTGTDDKGQPVNTTAIYEKQ
jgi:hypothetical protein